MANTRITIELSSSDARFDACIRWRNSRVIGRPVTRTSELRRVLIEEIGTVDRLPRDFWTECGGASPKVDPS